LSSLPDFVDTIGYSPNTERKQLNEVVDMVGEGVLEATVIQYNPDENLPIQEVRSVSESGRQNESDDHLRLKAIVADQGSASAEVVLSNYLSEVEPRKHRRTLMCKQLRLCSARETDNI